MGRQWHWPLLLLLLLDTSVWAQDEVLDSVSQSCSNAARFKHLRKYVYDYEAESSSGVHGTADARSATKIHCKVELEVPQLCSFILRTSQCTLKEVYAFNPEGKALMKKTENSEEFAAAMSRYELKLAIPEGQQVVLYPEKDEPTHILNIKRGIISALLVPLETEEAKQKLFLDTVYGNCSTHLTVQTRKGSVATEISMERNLQECDGFQPISTSVSPLALIKGLVRPLSTLISSRQSCQCTLDPKRKHVSAASCQEQHLVLPFSYKNKYGMMTQVTQTLKLEDTPKINSRYFGEGAKQVGLAFESTKSASPPKQAEAVLRTLQELKTLSISEQNAQRGNLFNKLVTELRGLSHEAIASLLPQLIQVSSPITLQALVQCGQPQCYTHILQWLKSVKAHPLLIDVVTYLVAMIPNPSVQRLREIFNTAKEQQSRATLYALSHVVNNYHEMNYTVNTDLQEIAEYLLEQISNECTAEEDHVYLILRVIGNMGRTMGKVMPALKSSVMNCIKSTKPSLLIQKAALQALRKMELDREVRGLLLETFVDATSPVEKRLAAYLLLMRGPYSSDINRIIQLLPGEQNEQVKSFVASHLANILNSEELYMEDLKNLVKEVLKESQLPTIMDFRKFSRNYHFSKSVYLPTFDPFSAKIEGNLIFDPNNYLPIESMLKTTLTVFGFASTDLFEIGLEGKGFEPTVEALFGKRGFFPDSVNKALYWVNGKVPDHVSKVLVDHFGYSQDDKHEQDMVTGIMPIVEKLIKDLKANEIPEARAYLRILGEELGFVKLQDLQFLGRMLMSGVHTLRGIPQMIGDAIREGSRNDLFLHYIFMDNAFALPTGMGLQLQVTSSGVITPRTKAGVKLELANMQAELVAKPSMSVEFVTNMGTVMPGFARSSVQMNTNFFHEAGLEARVTLKAGQLKIIIPSPKRPVKLFSGSNTLHLVSTAKTEVIPPLIENRQSWSTCKPLFTGMNYCRTGAYSNASSTETASYYPLTGDTRYELELKPTGEVEQYSASATYQLQREERGLVDTLKFLVQAEGVKETEASMLFRYNRRSKTLSSEIQIPDFDIDFGTILRVTDESSKDKKSYRLFLDIQNKKITEVAFVGHVSSDEKGDGKIKGVISIPRLQAEARSEIHTHWSPTKLLLQMDSSATAYGSTVSKRLAWRYDEEKIEFDWNTGTNVDTKKVASNFPVDLSDYLGTLHAYASSLLDHRVPQTDMTFRYMGSNLIAGTSIWLDKVSRGIPYTQTLQDHLSGLVEFPDFHMPDNLFLKSDGRIKYALNRNSVKIDIPLPLGGKSSKDLKMLESIRTPAVNLKSVGLHLPSQEFRVPTFTIPTSYRLQVPLLGVLDLSTNVYSNLYNWSASYTGGNTSRDHFSLQAQYRMKASSAVDLLSYSVQGSGETTYDYRNTFTLSCDGSLRHKFLESKIKFSHVEKAGNSPASKGLLTFDASSALGPQMSATVHVDSKKKQHLYVRDVKVDGQFRAASLYAKGTYGLSCQSDPSTGQLSGESNLRFNSSYLQGTNQITGIYQDGTLSVTSTSDLQDGIFKNTASLKYENYELTVKSDTNGQYENFATSNKVDMTFSKQSALLRSEYQANYKSMRLFTLLSGSLNPHGVELNADIMGTDKTNTGAHKATLRIARDGMSTSATTNLKYSPLLLESEMNAALGLSGASVKLTTNSRFREHYAKFSLDGKAALKEVSLGSACQAMILGVDSKNVFNFKINQEGLKLSNDMMGSYAEMKLDHANSLNIAGLSLDFSSKLDNIYSADKFYKQNFNLQLQPYSLVTALDNNLKYSALDLTSNGKLQLEPLKLNVAGDLQGAYRNDKIKHIYTISYADLSANYRADTVARVQETEFSHRLNTDISGLASSIEMVTNYNSDSLHFSNVFHSRMAPLNLVIEAHTSGDGKLALWGEHNGKLYSKFLFRVEPLSLTFSHDLRESTSHHLLSGNSFSTDLNHRITTLLTPAEQTGTWEFKTKLNDNEYSQNLEAYNTEDKIGVELSGRALTDLSKLDSPVKVPFLLSEPINVFNTLEIKEAADKPQEFSIVAFIKYDKNQDVHAISLPFFQSLPEYLERNRRAIVTVLETIQKELKGINIDQFVREYRAALSRLPQEVNEYLNALNLERQVSRAKEKLTAFRENYKITENDVQIALDNAKINLNEKLSQLQTYMIQFDQYIKDNSDLHDFKITIIKIIDQIIEKLKSLDEYYHIRVNLVKSIHDLYLFVENVDFNRIGSSTASWIENVDTKYQIRIQIQDKLQQLETQVQNTDIQQLAARLKQQVEAIDVAALLDQLRTRVLFQRIKDMIEHVKYFVMNLIGNFKVTERINTFRAIVHEFIEKYEVDQQIQVFMDKSVQLAHQYKLKETVQKLSNILQRLAIKDYYEKLVGFIDGAIKQLKALSFKKFIEEVNRFLDMLVKKLKSFDFHQFVDETNNKIREVTQRINGEIQALEVPRKAAALKLWVEDFTSMVSKSLEQLKDTKVTFFIDCLQGVLVRIKAHFHDTLEDIRDRIYQMDIQQDLKRYLSLVSQVYSTLVTYISDWWILASKNLTDLAEQYSIQNWSENVKAFVEKGFIVPEIRTFLGTMPAFEVSLRALQAATFQTPEFIVPLTDLRIPSVQINFKMLKDMKIPLRFCTPEFTILNTVDIPSFTIDLIEIKAKIIRTIDQILSSDLEWPVPEVYLKDLMMGDTPFTGLILPDLHFPEIAIPDLRIPNLNFEDIHVPHIHIPEFQLPRLSHTISIPAFGKLHSVLKLQSPLFTLDANANIRNESTPVNKAEITASVTAKAESKLEVLNFDFQAHAQLVEPNTNPLVLKESVNFSSKNLRMEHESEMQFSGWTLEGKSDTVASLHTEKNTVEFNNGVILKINNQLTLDSHTKYFHKLNIPKLDFSSKASFNNEIKTLLEAGHMAWTSSGRGSWNWACPNFSDEGIHSSQISLTVEGLTTSFGLSNSINSKHLRVMQKLACVSSFLNSSMFEIESKAESQHVGSSVLTAKGKALLREGKAEITGEHNADLNGKVIGTLKNSLFFSAQPFEITASMSNEGNFKVSFPLKLTGKVEFLNNYALLLNPLTQQASWQAGARFNQYKYNQNFTAVNNENSMEAHVGMNGDANLDFLNIPLTIPEINVPYTTLTTPSLKDFSIWEETGLKEFLKTTKQSFDLSVKAQYKKNKDKHSIVIPLGAFYEFIHQNVNSLEGHFEKIRDNALHVLSTSYNEAKSKFEKYKMEESLKHPSRTFQSRGYTIPVFNIEVSPFTIETLASSHVISTPSFSIPGPNVYVPSYRLVLPSLELPALHVPKNLPKFSLPDIKQLGAINNIFIPAMGNFTYDFSFKSSVITLNTNAGLYNQSDIVAHFLSSSSFVMEALQYKLEGTSRLARKRGLKLATALSLSNKFVEGNHDSTISLTKKNIDASVKTTASLHLPALTMNFKQELNGNAKSKPTISSSIELQYDFNSPKLHSTAKGQVDHKFSLESLTSYFSVESSAKGNIKGSILSQKYSGNIASEASTYLNSKGTRSSVRLQGASKVDGIWNLEVDENFAGEANLRRIYATWEHDTKNYLQLKSFITRGEQTCKAILEVSPWTLSALVQVQASQPSSLLDIPHFGQEVTLNANPKNQKVIWKSEVQAHSEALQHSVQFSNDQKEARLDISGSLEGQSQYLENVILPVYDKSLLDILKLVGTTSSGGRQYLRASTSLVYTKNPNGYAFSFPVQELADRFIIPGLKLNGLNLVLATPTFQVPFTDLQIPSYQLGINGVSIYKKLSTSPFALNLPALPKVLFPKVDVLAKYSEPEDSSVPFFEITVPEGQLIVSQFTLPKSFPVGSTILDLNEITNKMADFDLPTITLPEQKIEIPSFKFSVPAGIFIPFFGALAVRFGMASPLYNATWSAGLKNKGDHVETFLDSTCSSTLQFLEYDLNVVGTHRIDDGMLISKTKGALAHRDFSAEYNEDGRYKELWDWQGEARFDITSPAFTELHLYYQEDERSLSSSAASPAIGTLGLDMTADNNNVECNVYFYPQSSSDKKLSIFKTEWRSQKSDDQIQITLNWEEEATAKLLSSLRDSVPKATEAAYDYVNKYHQEYTGLNLRDASAKLRRSLQNNAEWAYQRAMRQIDEMDLEFQQAATGTTRTYQEWKDKARYLYEEMVAQEGQTSFHKLKDKVFDSLVQVTREYQITVKRLVDRFIDFLKGTSLRLPGKAGTYTRDELCTMIVRETGKALSQVCSGIHGSLEKLLSYVQDLVEKSDLINDITVRFPFNSRNYKLQDIILECRKLLDSLSQRLQQTLNSLQSIKFTEILRSLQSFMQRLFQDIEQKIIHIKEKQFTYFINFIHNNFNTHVSHGLRSLKEGLSNFNSFIQTELQVAAYKLQQVCQYIKALREEYFDPSMVGWTVKYYELEEKVINLIKDLIVALKDFHSKYTARAAGFSSLLSNQVDQFVLKDIQEYLKILADVDGKGRGKFAELSNTTKEIIKSWAITMKEIISDYHQQFNSKLQGFSDQLSDFYEKFIAESQRLIDLSIQSYHTFLRYITELLRKLQAATASEVSPYIQLAPGKLTITF